MRVEGGNTGFTLVHPGVQRVEIERRAEGGLVKHLFGSDRVLGEYRGALTCGSEASAPPERSTGQDEALPYPAGGRNHMVKW